MFKIRSIDSFSNVFQNPHFTKPFLINYQGEELDLRGKWNSDIFKNDKPLVLELACGKGDYCLALAQQYSGKNFIGVDSKGARLFNASKAATENNLQNLVFVRMRIENITQFFAPQEVNEIWITFPDPFPKKGSEKRRLTAPAFLERYKLISKPGASVHFKTDDLPLFHFTRDAVEESGMQIIYYKEDIYASPLQFPELEIKTYYERQHLEKGRTINYLSFRL